MLKDLLALSHFGHTGLDVLFDLPIPMRIAASKACNELQEGSEKAAPPSPSAPPTYTPKGMAGSASFERV